MKKQLSLILLGILLLSMMTFMGNVAHALTNNVYNVRTATYYPTIQGAIDAAATLDGDTLLVYPGTYNEQVTIDKALNITSTAGASQTFINASGLAAVPGGSFNLVTINAGGDVVFEGFTVANVWNVAYDRVGISSQCLSGSPTYTIVNNVIYGTNNATDDQDYGFYAQSGQENIVFSHNKITQTGANNILFELHTGATEISHNTLDAGVYGCDAVFFMTYNEFDVTTLQKVSFNTFDMSTGGPFDYDHRASAISFNTPDGAYGALTDAKFTNVAIQGNTINNLKSYRRGIGFWNGGGGGGGVFDPVVEGNIIAATAGSTASYGIDFIASTPGETAAENAIVMNNKISGTDCGIYLKTASCAPGAQIHYNTIAGNNRGLDNVVGFSDVDARFNWWGDASGPFQSVSNTGGLGNNVTDNVDYSPWLGVAVGTVPMTYHVNPTGTIQEAINEANSGDTIVVHSGTYSEALYINKSLTVKTASALVISGGHLFHTNYGDRQAVIFVNSTANVVLNGLDIEGLGLGVPAGTKSYGVIYQSSSGTIMDCTVSPNTVGDMFSTGIAAWDNSNLMITRCTVKNFGRIGVYSNNATLNIQLNTIIGQVYNSADLVNYGIEIEDYSGPSQATITQNLIHDCNNTNPNPSWSSAAIVVDAWREWDDVYNFNLLPSAVSITNNTIYNNYESIELVSSDLSYAHYNNFTNNAYGLVSAAENFTTHPTYYVFDALYNWWGDATGPHHTTSWLYLGLPYGPHLGVGDPVTNYVLYDPWLPYFTTTSAPVMQLGRLDKIITFNVTISNVTIGERVVGVQFRLCYNATLLQLLSVTEGSFMQDSRWNHYGTYFIQINGTDPAYGAFVAIGILLMPNSHGIWNDSFPYGNGTLATFTFKPLLQERGLEKPPLTCSIHLAQYALMNDNIGKVPCNAQDGRFDMLPTNICDLNNDYLVDMWDVGIAAQAFLTVPGDLRWNPVADVYGPAGVPDGIIDMMDIGFIAHNFGWTAADP